MTRRWANLESDKEGFYLSHQARNGKQTAILCCRIDTALTSPAIGGGAPSSSHPNSSAASNTKTNNTAAKSKKESIMFQVYRPNTGLQFRTESLAEIEKKYKKVQSDQAERHWTQQYDASVNTCSHAYWRGNCRNVSMGQDCEVGVPCLPLSLNTLAYRNIAFVPVSRSACDSAHTRCCLVLCWPFGHASNRCSIRASAPPTRCR